MTSPMFGLIKKNLAVPEDGPGSGPGTGSGCRGAQRPLKANTIAGVQIAWRLVHEQALSRAEASRIAARQAGCTAQTLTMKWRDYEARLRRDGLLP